MPLMVTGEYGHWRRVQDIDGQGGWMHFRLLSGTRTVTFKGEKNPLHRRSNEGSEILVFAEKGVIGKLEKCTKDWCKVYVSKEKGWVLKVDIWGVGINELRN
jgi:SH3-like domain-containing protein